MLACGSGLPQNWVLNIRMDGIQQYCKLRAAVMMQPTGATQVASAGGCVRNVDAPFSGVSGFVVLVCEFVDFHVRVQFIIGRD